MKPEAEPGLGRVRLGQNHAVIIWHTHRAVPYVAMMEESFTGKGATPWDAAQDLASKLENAAMALRQVRK